MSPGAKVGTDDVAGQINDVIILLACLFVGWQVLFLLTGDHVLASPLRTLQLSWAMIGTPEFYTHASSTGRTFLMSLAMSIGGGLLIGLLAGANRLIGEVVDPILVILHTIPKLALLPIVLLFLGIGMTSKAFFGALHGIIPVAIFTIGAVRNIPSIYLKTSRVLHLTWFQRFSLLIVPATLPEIFSGIRIGFSLTLIGVILSEMFGSKQGIGYLLMQALGTHSIDDLMPLTFLIVTFAGVTNWGLLVLAQRLRRTS